MPSAMIHLLVAGKIPGGEDPLFRLGSLAPDYLTQRAEKDAVHLRLEPDRFAALQKLAGRLDLRQALGELTDTQRTALLLQQEGYDMAELGQILDVPVGTVKSRISRAKQTLRTLLEDN